MIVQMPFGVHANAENRCLEICDCAIPETESCPHVARARPDRLRCCTHQNIWKMWPPLEVSGVQTGFERTKDQ
jgi:hypothetical protein